MKIANEQKKKNQSHRYLLFSSIHDFASAFFLYEKKKKKEMNIEFNKEKKSQFDS